MVRRLSCEPRRLIISMASWWRSSDWTKPKRFKRFQMRGGPTGLHCSSYYPLITQTIVGRREGEGEGGVRATVEGRARLSEGEG